MPSFGELLGAEIREAWEARGWTQLFVAEKAFAEEFPDTWMNYVRRIGDYETGKVKSPQVKVYQPLCEVLGITRPRIGALKAEAADAKTVTDDELRALRAEKGSLQRALDDVQTLSRASLETLATRFELDRPYEATDGALIEYLTYKAQDYRALRAEVEGIDAGVKALSNLKASAMAAYDAGDLDEVDVLLDRVMEIAKDEAAKAAEIKAEAALLRNRPARAYALLSDAADSFAILDPLEPARRSLAYGRTLFFHGIRYGGAALDLSSDLWRACAARAEAQGDAVLRGKALSNLGVALQDLGQRRGGAEGAALLAQAVTAYRAVLEVYTRDAHPVDWAMTQNNLANALQTQGESTGGAEGAALLAQAVTAYRAALEVCTRDAHPVDWAMTQNNLATALRAQGETTGGAEGAALLAQAVAAYRAALEVRTRDAYPVQWAMTQNNLAIALKTQGARTGGAEGAALLAQAVTAYRAALEVRTRDAHPVDWAMTQENLAQAEEARADHETCADPRAPLVAALRHVGLALEVFDPEHMPYNFDKATELKTRLEAKLSDLPEAP